MVRMSAPTTPCVRSSQAGGRSAQRRARSACHVQQQARVALHELLSFGARATPRPSLPPSLNKATARTRARQRLGSDPIRARPCARVRTRAR
jgi:hypothetical protein